MRRKALTMAVLLAATFASTADAGTVAAQAAPALRASITIGKDSTIQITGKRVFSQRGFHHGPRWGKGIGKHRNGFGKHRKGFAKNGKGFGKRVFGQRGFHHGPRWSKGFGKPYDGSGYVRPSQVGAKWLPGGGVVIVKPARVRSFHRQYRPARPLIRHGYGRRGYW